MSTLVSITCDSATPSSRIQRLSTITRWPARVRCSSSPSQCPSRSRRLRDLLHGLGKGRLQQFVADASQRLPRRPAVQPFRSLVPVDDAIVRVADQNRLVSLIQQLRLPLAELLALLLLGNVARDFRNADQPARCRRAPAKASAKPPGAARPCAAAASHSAPPPHRSRSGAAARACRLHSQATPAA